MQAEAFRNLSDLCGLLELANLCHLTLRANGVPLSSSLLNGVMERLIVARLELLPQYKSVVDRFALRRDKLAFTKESGRKSNSVDHRIPRSYCEKPAGAVEEDTCADGATT